MGWAKEQVHWAAEAGSRAWWGWARPDGTQAPPVGLTRARARRFAAFVWLRISAPHLVRPFRVGLPWWGCALMLAPASLLLLALIAMPVLRMDLQARVEPYGPLCTRPTARSVHCLTVLP